VVSIPRGRREAEVGEEAAQRGEVDEESDDVHRRAAVGAEQRVDLVDLADEDPCEVSFEPARSQGKEQGREFYVFFCHSACLSARFRFRFPDEAEVEELGYPEN